MGSFEWFWQDAPRAWESQGLPPGVNSYAILPIGWPMGKFGPVGRGDTSLFVFGDSYGQPWEGLGG